MVVWITVVISKRGNEEDIMEAILSIKNLNKSFGSKHIIKNVSFDVYAGEILGFLGPNGSGKTTTIKMIMGFLFPDSGDINICGFDVKKDYEKAMNLVGGIVENPEMYKDMTGMQNLHMYGRLHDGVTAERIKEVVEIVGMQARANEKIKKYSLGMKQRIGVAQAILHRPRLLILDEPTNGLDPAGIKELRDILKKLAHEENVAVLVSSHMLAEMELMCDRVAIIDNGKILDVKPIEDILHMVANQETYRFELDFGCFELAEEVIASAYGNEVINGSEQLENGHIAINVVVDLETIPAINKLLVDNNIAVYAIGRIENSLEDAFIEITGGGITIA